MGSPSGWVPERDLERFLVATEACGGGTPDLSSVLEVFRVYGYIWEEEVRQGSHEGPTRVEGAPRGWARPPASCLPRCFLDVDVKSPRSCSSQKSRFPKVSFRLDSI